MQARGCTVLYNGAVGWYRYCRMVLYVRARVVCKVEALSQGHALISPQHHMCTYDVCVCVQKITPDGVLLLVLFASRSWLH